MSAGRVGVRYLRSKILPPVAGPNHVARPHLVDTLAESGASLWLVAAPAGYGKTAIVTETLADRRLRNWETAWVTLDDLDNEPIRFWRHVAAAVIGEGDELATLLETIDETPPDRFGDVVIEAVERKRSHVALVLDDLHLVHDDDVIAAIGRMLQAMPENLTLVVTARSAPALPIGRLRSRGLLVELRAEDLAFTSDETAEYLGDVLQPAALATVLERTEGWVTALSLLRMSAEAGRAVDDVLGRAAGDRRDLAEYLSGEALASQDDATRQFLVATSILEDLTPGLCDAVTLVPGSLSTLRALTGNQVFTFLVDPERNTYRYHGLFREFLRSRALELPPEERRELHRRAAAWSRDHGEHTRTILHAVEAGEIDLARTVILENYLGVSQQGMFNTLARWLQLFGIDRCEGDPELILSGAWAALNLRNYEEMHYWLSLPALDGAPHTDRGPVAAEVHTIRSHHARHVGRLDEAVVEGRRAVELAASAGDVLQVAAGSALGAALTLAGHHDEHLEALLSDVIARGREPLLTSERVAAYGYLAFVCSQRPDSMDRAGGLSHQAISLVDTPRLERFMQPALAWLVKSRADLAEGRIGDATEAAERALDIAALGHEPAMQVFVLAHQSIIAHQLGRIDEARDHLRRAEELLTPAMGTFVADHLRSVRSRIRFATLPRDLPPGALELTEREMAVLRLLPHDLSRRELADQLYISVNTVKTHLTSIRHKLGTSDRHELVERARRLGLLDRG